MATFEKVVSQVFDLIVIGGGINGAAIARDAALRGLKVILFEKNDFGCGASTKTSKLAHGGLRYLEQFEFSLVKESLVERTLLMKNAPHLVRPLPFVFPVYRGDPRPVWQVNLGLYLYDYLARQNELPRHGTLTQEAILRYFPLIKSSDLSGGCLYSDAQMLDNRLVIENIISAEQAGAIVLNHTPVIKLSRSQGHVDGVFLKRPIFDTLMKVQGRTIVNATGAWSDHLEKNVGEAPLVAPTKGVHLIIPQIDSKYALILRTPQDRRFFFVIPWGGYSLVGTTDTFYNGDPDAVDIDEDDRSYLLEALNFYFPRLNLNETSIIAEFAGLRPLCASAKSSFPSDISRTHQLQRFQDGLITVLGGKYTTHRRVAEDVVDMVIRQLPAGSGFLPCKTATVPLPGAAGTYSLEEVNNQLSKAGLQYVDFKHLRDNYGTASLYILDIILNSGGKEGRRLCSDHSHLLAEVTYAIQAEHAKTLEDWFFRRTSIAYTGCRGRACLSVVADKFEELLGWKQEEKEAAIRAYQSLLQ